MTGVAFGFLLLMAGTSASRADHRVAAAPSANTVEAPSQSADASLVLLISVDQMRGDYLERFGPQLRGGFKRLVTEGLVFDNARQDHALTATAPGHAAMLSGLYPNANGIVDNGWWDRDLGRRERASADPDFRLVGLEVPDDGPGGSPRQFLGSSLVGWLKDRSPDSRAVSISRKDRSAVLMAPEADQAYWHHWSGRFVTSSYYQDELPGWVASFNEQGWLDAYNGATWELSEAPDAYAGSRPDEYEGETPPRGFGSIFPHTLPTDPQRLGTQINTTPFMDQAVFDLGKAAVEALSLGQEAATDVLALSLSSTDSIGHSFGPYSREVHDQILRLDLMLGDFLDFVDAAVGLDRTLIILTADHGVVALPEYSRELGEPAERLRMAAVRRGIDEYVAEDFGGAEWFDTYSYGNLYVDREQATQLGVDADALIAKAKEYVASLDFVAAVFSQDDLASESPPQSEIEELARRSFYPSRSGDLYVVHQPLSQWQVGSAANHQSPYQYDRHVPLILRGPGISPGSRQEIVAIVDIAPTLAKLLGITPPAGLPGSLLPGF